MISLDLEHLNNFLTEYNRESIDPIAAMEAFINNSSVDITTFDDVIGVKRSFAKVYLDQSPVEASPQADPNKDIPFIKKSDTNEYLFIVDFEIVMSLWGMEPTKTSTMLKFIENIPEKATVNVISMLPPDLNTWLIPDIITIGNFIRLIKGKTIFNINAQLNFNDLAIASFCDELAVSQFAAISITEAAVTNSVLPAMHEVYQEYVKGIYNYWIDKGLFTSEEVTNLFSSEAVGSINLQSSEIKSRLNF
jgi:hypothetical protein